MLVELIEKVFTVLDEEEAKLQVLMKEVPDGNPNLYNYAHQLGLIQTLRARYVNELYPTALGVEE